MRSRNWWDESQNGPNPMRVVQKIAGNLHACAECGCKGASQDTVNYLWLFLEAPGASDTEGTEEPLTLDEWLNLVDEAAALGTRWVVLCPGPSPSKSPVLWEICSWAQETHGLKVALHVQQTPVDNKTLGALRQVSPELTSLLADTEHIDALKAQVAPLGLRVCAAEHEDKVGDFPCSLPENIVCVGPTGQLFTCGRVLGNSSFNKGHGCSKELSEVLNRAQDGHRIPDTVIGVDHGCDLCPPEMARRLEHS